jgi:hypothetical protein
MGLDKNIAETDLYLPVKEYLSRLGYRVTGEAVTLPRSMARS